MNKIGSRIYYDKTTGNVIAFKGEMQGNVVETTIEQDIATFSALSSRNRDSFDVISLTFGAFAQDFRECNGFRIHPETKNIEFSYPDPSEPDAPSVFQKPLTEQVADLQSQLSLVQMAIDEMLLGGL